MNVRVVAAAAALLLAAGTAAPTSASAQVIGDDASGNCYPFICFTTDGGTRYQQVYAASAFAPAPMAITSLSWYCTNADCDPSETFDNASFHIRLSTTSAGPNALSTNLASNVGVDQATFFDGTLSGTLGTGFTIIGTPFVYDPSAGNLLVDFLVTSVGAPKGYDTFLDAGDVPTTSRAAINGAGPFVDETGLRTGFNTPTGNVVGTVTATPEPATVALVAGGLLALGGIARRRRQA